jgi:hypothetical protein
MHLFILLRKWGKQLINQLGLPRIKVALIAPTRLATSLLNKSALPQGN